LAAKPGISRNVVARWVVVGSEALLMTRPPAAAEAFRDISKPGDQLPTASEVHFLTKLVFAAPASFFDAA